MAAKTPKEFFSEAEASRSLGITVEDFRRLVKQHIVVQEEDMTNVSVTTYHASDLLVLRWILGRSLAPSSAPPAPLPMPEPESVPPNRN